MKYYRVRPECDNKKRYRFNGQGKSVPDGILIANELYTPAEYSKIANSPACFDIIEISKRRVYWFFGARFEVVRF